MLQNTQTSTDRPASDSVAQPATQPDHAFPMLGTESYQIPPFFRFMWAAR